MTSPRWKQQPLLSLARSFFQVRKESGDMLGVAGAHRNNRNTASNVLVDPFLINDVRGLLTLIKSTPASRIEREAFRLCQAAGAIRQDLEFDDCKVQINLNLGKLRVVSKDYCPLAESDELWSEIDRIVKGGARSQS